MRIVPFDSSLEPLFWRHVYMDIVDYYFFILDMKLDRDKTEVILAVDDEKDICGIMLVYRGSTVQFRGSAEAAEALLARLSIEKIETTIPAECSPSVIPQRYEVKKTFDLTVMALRKEEETPKINHALVRLTRADAEGIAAIMREGDPEFWGEIKAEQIAERMPQRLWLGIRADGKLVSVGGARIDDWCGHIHTVATREDCRSRGYATSITSALVEQILEKSNLACIHVRSENVPAIRAYTKAGFKPYKKYVVIRAEKRQNKGEKKVDERG